MWLGGTVVRLQRWTNDQKVPGSILTNCAVKYRKKVEPILSSYVVIPCRMFAAAMLEVYYAAEV